MSSTPAFLIGAPRSGTSWWLRSLSTHPQIAGMGEAQLFTNCGAPQTDTIRSTLSQPFWKRLGQLESELGPDLPETIDWQPGQWGRPVYAPISATTLRALLAIRDSLHSFPSFDAVAGAVFSALDGTAPVLLEKSPINALRMNRILEQFPDARFLGIVRDGRDVMASARSLGEDWIRAHGELAFAAPFWAEVCRVLLAARVQLAGRVHLVRYEDLLRDPVTCLAEAYRFLGLEVSDSELRATVALNDFRRYSGRRAGDASPGSFFGRGTSGGYRTVLSSEEIAEFERIAGPMLKTLGYPLESESLAGSC